MFTSLGQGITLPVLPVCLHLAEAKVQQLGSCQTAFFGCCWLTPQPCLKGICQSENGGSVLYDAGNTDKEQISTSSTCRTNPADVAGNPYNTA